MYSRFLILIMSLINVAGTTYAVLSILKLHIKDIYSSITLGGMDNRDNELLVQREQARIGITLISLGWIGEVVFTFVNITSEKQFYISLGTIAVITFSIIFLLCKTNQRFRKKYKEYKEKSPNDTHIDDHSITVF